MKPLISFVKLQPEPSVKQVRLNLKIDCALVALSATDASP